MVISDYVLLNGKGIVCDVVGLNTENNEIIFRVKTDPQGRFSVDISDNLESIIVVAVFGFLKPFIPNSEFYINDIVKPEPYNGLVARVVKGGTAGDLTSWPDNVGDALSIGDVTVVMENYYRPVAKVILT